jgi:hypothetical protein
MGITICLVNRRKSRAAKRFGGLITQPFIEERGPLAVPQKRYQEDNTPPPPTPSVSATTHTDSQREIVIQHVDAVGLHEIHVPPPYPATHEHA